MIVFDHRGLAVFMIGLRLGEERGDVGGRGENLRGRGPVAELQAATPMLVKAKLIAIIPWKPPVLGSN